jgi:hypothetical protein
MESVENDKNHKRILDIISKSGGDKEKENKLSKVQADRITNESKAINRARVAKELGHENIYEIFFRRAYELGSVPTQEYREYVLTKILED